MQVSALNRTFLSPTEPGSGTPPQSQQAVVNAASAAAADLAAIPSTGWKTVAANTFPSHTVQVQNGPSEINEIEVKTFKLGTNGPSFQMASLGATPLQITTADGKNLLWNSLTQDDGALKPEIKWDLRGAGFLGGAPIVAPASRIADENGKPIIRYKNRVIDLSKFVGAKNRIPKDNQDENALAMHGAIFTSPHWKLDKLETKGENAQDAIKATYTLNFADDEALKPFIFGDAGSATVVYELTKDDKGNPVFKTELKFENPSHSNNEMLLGAVAQHCFFDPGPDKDQTRLRTNLMSQYEGWFKGHQSLPTGKILDIESGSIYDFFDHEGVPIYARKDQGQPLDAVLTNEDNRQPEATIQRSDGLNVVLKTGGRFNSLVVCTKNRQGLMIEPIAGLPNSFTRPGPRPGSDDPIVLKSGDSEKFTSVISLAS